MYRTGDAVERQMQQERLEAAAKELGEYARLLNSKKETIDARRRQLEIAAGSPYIAYTDAVQKSFGQYVVPPPVKEGVQMNINVNHHKAGPVNMNINVDDADDWDDKDWDESANAFSSDEIPIDTAAEKSNEQQALTGASGTKHLSLQEMNQGKVVLRHIRDKLDAAATKGSARKGKRTHSISSKKALAKHHQHLAIAVSPSAAATVVGSKVAPVAKYAFSDTAS